MGWWQNRKVARLQRKQEHLQQKQERAQAEEHGSTGSDGAGPYDPGRVAGVDLSTVLWQLGEQFRVVQDKAEQAKRPEILKLTTAKATFDVAVKVEGEAKVSFKVLKIFDVDTTGSASREKTTTIEVNMEAIDDAGGKGVRWFLPPGTHAMALQPCPTAEETQSSEQDAEQSPSIPDSQTTS